MRAGFLFRSGVSMPAGNYLTSRLFESEERVKTDFLWLIVLGAMLSAVLSSACLAPAQAADGEVISVDLQTFKFKVRPEVAELFGYNDGEDKLFYYAGGAGETTVKLPA